MPATAPRMMAPLLTAAAMREADTRTIDEYGLPGFTLMETAGRGAAHEIDHAFGPVRGKRVLCLCGKGNNGGDGFVVARVLRDRGAQVDVVALGDEETMRDDALHNYMLLHALVTGGAEGLTVRPFESVHQLDTLPPADILVDALLGTGLTSALRDPLDGIVNWMNGQGAFIAALDVPTGLHSDTGAVLGTAVTARLSVTMGTAKAGMYLNEGPRRCGRIRVVDIGIPSFVLDAACGGPGCAALTSSEAVLSWLPTHPPHAHKYSVGLALVVGGSPGMTGAPVMASMAAARAGAGYVVCACDARIQDVLAAKMTEVTTLALPAGDDGGLDEQGALAAIDQRLTKARSLLVGCGLGRRPSTQRFVRTLLSQTDLPLVVDADGLNALEGFTSLIAERAGGRWILTPHAGEFRRLAGDDADVNDPVRTAQTYARKWNVVLLLKGQPSVVATPEGAAYVTQPGNSALATAGTGDVLAGLCAGLLAQGMTPEHAAVAALHLGGLAADRFAASRDYRSMVATDLIEELPFVLSSL